VEFITKYKDIAEFIYFLSGPLMLIGLVIGLYQLKYLKKDISVRVSRESILLSVSIMEDKFKELNKHTEKAFNDDHFPDRPFFEGKVAGFHRSTIESENDFLSQMESMEHSEFVNSIYDCLGSLETLAQYINSGVCDEEKCYRLEGPLFISHVDDLREFIAFERKNEDDNLYENIVSLYQLWAARLEHDNLLKKSNEINTKLKYSRKPRALKVIGK